MTPDDRTPVIVGCGEAVDRPAMLSHALDPIGLMALAARRANEDAGGRLLHQVDRLAVVNLVSWRYADPPAELAGRLGIAPRSSSYAPIGGETPTKLVHEAALAIARGEAQVALIAGGEAQHSAARAQKEGKDLPWPPFAHDAPARIERGTYLHPLAIALGASMPVSVYPFYEMASAYAWGQTPAAAQVESAETWARYAAVAAENPSSWLGRRYTADDIARVTPDNRLIAWPYTKLMVANPMVNQGAAVIVTSLAVARAAGIDPGTMIHLVGGAAADEPRDYLARDGYTASPAQDAVLARARALNDGRPFDALELYSCFPCVPKMARRTLGLGADMAPTVTGGLTFFGAPLNDYMLHATAAMVRRLRSVAGTGLLYGQGEFVTKHHALVLSSARSHRALDQDYSVAGDAEKRRGPVPPTVMPADGTATLETATVLYRRDGTVDHGVVILRTEDGARTMAAVAPDDRATLAAIVDRDRYPVGRNGTIAAGDVPRWAIA
ncbi:acetyl-CoA acetyltransferase [Sphingomonas mali]|uniref:acetyl-CoA acetyltransferase n=1 Tax=Sphingomonas mali TaxID=40682 RepID=UPI00082F9F93|nr:acetyl-CoA acetyltransferase [Sphingomonas mali]